MTPEIHILIAPNAFKNSLTATDAATAIEKGFHQSRLRCSTECFPVGDGGDGTGRLLVERLGADIIEATARDPFGRERHTSLGLLTETQTAIIEMADASGLRLLDREELDPLHARSTGTGDLIRTALDHNARRIIIGMGGSATVDGGMGILTALGVRFSDEAIDLSGLDPRLTETTITVLCDVANPLLGPQGAAAVFGPQKGATPQVVQQLEKQLQQLAILIKKATGKEVAGLPSGGTAGGAAAGLYGLLGAHLVNGIDYFLQLTGFDEALERSHLVITGEGSLDEQTLQGKAPYGVAVHAKKKDIPVIGLAGRLPANTRALDEYFDALLPINRQLVPPAEAIRHTAANLTVAARTLGNLLDVYHTSGRRPDIGG